METPAPDFSNTPPPDPYGVPSGTPAPAAVHLGSPDVEIQDIFVTVISYPQLGAGGVEGSFDNTRGSVNVDYVSLSRGFDGEVEYFVEDFNNKEELEDGVSAVSPGTAQITINAANLTLGADEVSRDGSMDVTISLQQIVDGRPYVKSQTLNIPNPNYDPSTPGVTPPPERESEGVNVREVEIITDVLESEPSRPTIVEDTGVTQPPDEATPPPTVTDADPTPELTYTDDSGLSDQTEDFESAPETETVTISKSDIVDTIRDPLAAAAKLAEESVTAAENTIGNGRPGGRGYAPGTLGLSLRVQNRRPNEFPQSFVTRVANLNDMAESARDSANLANGKVAMALMSVNQWLNTANNFDVLSNTSITDVYNNIDSAAIAINAAAGDAEETYRIGQAGKQHAAWQITSRTSASKTTALNLAGAFISILAKIESLKEAVDAAQLAADRASADAAARIAAERLERLNAIKDRAISSLGEDVIPYYRKQEYIDQINSLGTTTVLINQFLFNAAQARQQAIQQVSDDKVKEAEARAEAKRQEEEDRTAQAELEYEAQRQQGIDRAARLEEIAAKRFEARERSLNSRLELLTWTEITELAEEIYAKYVEVRDSNLPADAKLIQMRFLDDDLGIIQKFLDDNPELVFEDPTTIESQLAARELSQTAKNINKVLLDAMPINFGTGLSKVDFSGVNEAGAENWSPQNQNDRPPPWRKAATLITPQHVVLSKHWPVLYGPNDPFGGEVVFVDKNGNRITRRIVLTQNLDREVGGNSKYDVTVGLLNEPVDNVTIYSLPQPKSFTEYSEILKGSHFVRTDQERKALIVKYGGGSNNGVNITFPPHTNVDEEYRESDNYINEPLERGDSSSPTFIYTNNTPILIETHFTTSGGPFYGTLAIQELINKAITKLAGETMGVYGGNYTPNTVDIDEELLKGISSSDDDSYGVVRTTP